MYTPLQLLFFFAGYTQKIDIIVNVAFYNRELVLQFIYQLDKTVPVFRVCITAPAALFFFSSVLINQRPLLSVAYVRPVFVVPFLKMKLLELLKPAFASIFRQHFKTMHTLLGENSS